MSDDLQTLLGTIDATALAALVQQGDVTPRELAAAALTLADEVGRPLGAIVHTRDERALADADAAPEGPFRGVPLLVKDAVCTTAGDPYAFGLRFLAERGYVAPDDTELARRFKAAGFVVVGKTTSPELATSAVTEPLAFGPARNPWDPDRSPGGSSGGSAAVVAAGVVPLAHGNDMGGSIRLPASLCGLVGLKPSRGRTTQAPRGEIWGTLTHEHVLTRSVRDTAAVLDAVGGALPGDAWSPRPLSRPFLDEVGADPGRLRVGLRTTRPGGGEVDPVCVEVARQAATLLESLGHHVEEASPAPLDAPRPAGWAYGLVMAVGVADEVERLGRAAGAEIPLDALEEWNAGFVELGRATTGLQLAQARDALVIEARALVAWWRDDPAAGDGYDLLLTPTTAAPAPAVGALGPAQPREVLMAGLGALACMTSPWNLTGQPAISLPLGTDPGGVPLGAQLVAAPGRDDLLLRIAAQVETVQPWATRRAG